VTSPAPYDRRLGAVRIVAVWLLILALVAAGRPTAPGFGLGLLFVAAGEFMRIWAAGHLRKTVDLITSGPYRFTRNPLYLGRLSIFTGFCVMARLPYGLNWAVLFAGWAIFFGYYLPRKERVEPGRLRAVHGERYERYHRAVPALLPALRPYPAAADLGWSAARFLVNREHWMTAALSVAIAWLAYRLYSTGTP
jgi:protein-S-isoprenylcysteine O-methyltransferase Ste14